jgi:hypothetical protein
VFSPSFLLTDDKTWRGNAPAHLSWYKYEKGFSDHLPIIADLNSNKRKIVVVLLTTRPVNRKKSRNPNQL